MDDFACINLDDMILKVNSRRRGLSSKMYSLIFFLCFFGLLYKIEEINI